MRVSRTSKTPYNRLRRGPFSPARCGFIPPVEGAGAALRSPFQPTEKPLRPVGERTLLRLALVEKVPRSVIPGGVCEALARNQTDRD